MGSPPPLLCECCKLHVFIKVSPPPSLPPSLKGSFEGRGERAPTSKLITTFQTMIHSSLVCLYMHTLLRILAPIKDTIEKKILYEGRKCLLMSQLILMISF